MRYSYKPKGVCSQEIILDIDGNTVKEVKFIGGCNGNLKAISTLVKGSTVQEIARKLAGITCGNKSTSCSDQLAKAVLEAAVAAKAAAAK